MRVAFRTDASVQIGTGHVMRCLTLAVELRGRGHQCLFICRSHKGHMAEFIKGRGFEVYLLHSPAQSETRAKDEFAPAHFDWLGASWETDSKETLEALDDKIDWLVVDHYALDAKWERQLAGTVGQIMVIDDLADRKHECAILLDQNLGRQASDYDGLVPELCTKLIGPRYAMLRPEFAELRPDSLERRRSPKLKRILISLGGVDRTNVTGQILEALSKSTLPPQTKLDVVMGDSAPHLDRVKLQAFELPFQTTVSVGVGDMAERMCAADFSIGGAGSTSWERCCLGLPSLMILLADNQKLIGTALKHAGCAELSADSEVADRVKEVIERISGQRSVLELMSDNSQEVCDGNGCIRVAEFLNCGSK